MAVIKKIPSLPDLVDRLGQIKADIADLEKEEKKSVDTLKTRGVGEYTGKLFAAQIFTQERGNVVNWEAVAKGLGAKNSLIERYTVTRTVSTTDWEALARLLEPNEALVKKHTTVGQTIIVCKVTARK